MDRLEQLMAEAGFQKIHIEPQIRTSQNLAQEFPDSGLEGFVASAHLSARKPPSKNQ
jgi:hypothetical protein